MSDRQLGQKVCKVGIGMHEADHIVASRCFLCGGIRSWETGPKMLFSRLPLINFLFTCLEVLRLWAALYYEI